MLTVFVIRTHQGEKYKKYASADGYHQPPSHPKYTHDVAVYSPANKVGTFRHEGCNILLVIIIVVYNMEM